MRLFDACCGAGGAARGYVNAGFSEALGVDIEPQPNYPYDFIQGDVLEVLRDLLDGGVIGPSRDGRYYQLEDFDGFHASVPCQAFTQAQRLQGNEHPDLVAPVRALLVESGLPYVMENVPGSPLIDPIELCGAMFPPMRTYRHRLFESNVALPQPPHPPHIARQAKMGRRPAEGEWIQVVGNFTDAPFGRTAMGADWMTRDELSESIPPAYTEWVGRYVLAALRAPALAAAA